MSFECYPTKNEINLAKHGIAFEDAIRIFGGRTVESDDMRHDYGETRVQAIGAVRGLIVQVVYTARHGRRRIISARLANQVERRIYAQSD